MARRSRADWWDRSGEAAEMLDILNERNAPRQQFRMLGYECCRRLGPLLPGRAARDAVPLIREWAVGRLSDEHRVGVRERVDAAIKAMPAYRAGADAARDNAGVRAALAVSFALWDDVRQNHGPAEGAGYVLLHASQAVALSRGVHWTVDHGRWHDELEAEKRAQADLIRQLFPNPFRRVAGG